MTRRKKLLLTFPNQRWLKEDVATTWNLPPNTLCLLGAMVKDIVDVEIIDAQRYEMTPEQFRDEVKARKPDFVGISQLTSEYADTMDMVTAIVKEASKDIVVMAGGVHVTTQYQSVLNNPHIDFACRGEGEYLLRELLLYLMGKGEFPKAGLIYRDDGKIKIQDRVLVEDMTKLPWPDYDLVKLEDYIYSYGRYGPNQFPEPPGISVLISRGCPYTCSFCQVDTISGRKIRSRDPKDVVDEFEYLKKRYGLKSVVFEDDNLFAKKKYAKAVMQEMFDRRLNFKWSAASFSVWTLDDEMLDLMEKSGCVTVNVAIESGNDRVLKDIIHKPIKDLAIIPEKIAQLKSRGMFVISNFIIGSPGETWEEIRETIWFAENCHADYVKFFVAVPLYGTEMHQIAEEEGLLGDDIDPDNSRPDWRFSRVKSDEWTARDVSILRAYEWDRINFAPNRIQRLAKVWRMSIEELNEIRQKTRESIHEVLLETL